MAVKLIEKFSESIPSWLQKALHNKIKYNNSMDGGVYGWELTNRYPLGTLTFEEKEIPKTKKAIEDDWRRGNVPVLNFTFPKMKWVTDENGNERREQVGESSYTFILPHDYESFASDWKHSIPYNFREQDWKELKKYFTHYGVIPNFDMQRQDYAQTKKNRSDIKRQLNKITDPETVSQFNKAKFAKNGYALRMFRKIDAKYDELTDLFNSAIASFDTMTEEEINECYQKMKSLESVYEKALGNVQSVLNQDIEGKGYNGVRNGEVDQRFRDKTISDHEQRKRGYWYSYDYVSDLNRTFDELEERIQEFKTLYHL